MTINEIASQVSNSEKISEAVKMLDDKLSTSYRFSMDDGRPEWIKDNAVEVLAQVFSSSNMWPENAAKILLELGARGKIPNNELPSSKKEIDKCISLVKPRQRKQIKQAYQQELLRTLKDKDATKEKMKYVLGALSITNKIKRNISGVIKAISLNKWREKIKAESSDKDTSQIR